MDIDISLGRLLCSELPGPARSACGLSHQYSVPTGSPQDCPLCPEPLPAPGDPEQDPSGFGEQLLSDPVRKAPLAGEGQGRAAGHMEEGVTVCLQVSNLVSLWLHNEAVFLVLFTQR